ncbi:MULTISPECIES: transcriptional regulator [unclassified Psychrobacillus]|uniref:transcriptional regulator n=1 Tax=unclassified Psychrobacillus TaxID=2636677 RepID=UPI00146C3691|nr:MULTISPECIES: transcriptional regulator [unclassified Psychrobacillus]MCM3356468.1 transcriptional regulator [Psychrobacillus sp. MER TA 171]NME05763.1 transcriptional regulator [Psychrobacillus sp. BL-248-WT-3]
MLLVQLMKPFYTQLEGDRIKLVFAYQYFSLRKDDELFDFIPVEGKEIIVNANSLQVENLSEVFVFQKGNRFIRLPLYQLLLVSDIHVHLQTIINANNVDESSSMLLEGTQEIIDHLEKENFDRMIDYALLHKDATLFRELQQYKDTYGGHHVD